jgi:hypothetical protein
VDDIHNSSSCGTFHNLWPPQSDTEPVRVGIEEERRRVAKLFLIHFERGTHTIAIRAVETVFAASAIGVVTAANIAIPIFLDSVMSISSADLTYEDIECGTTR